MLYAINHRLLVETDRTLWSIIEPPEESALAEIAAKREHYFRLFLRKFDGELCKDPLMCLTLPFWEPYWPELQYIVFCLRHPLAVAQSVIKRYWVPLELGFELWRTYVTRFFNADRRKKVFIFDFDAFCRSPEDNADRTFKLAGIVPSRNRTFSTALAAFFMMTIFIGPQRISKTRTFPFISTHSIRKFTPVQERGDKEGTQACSS